MKKLYITPILLMGIILSILGCGTSDTSSTDQNISSINYPLKEYLGNLWGYDWYKIKASYDGDNRYDGNEVELNNSEGYILLKAYKKENQTSRARVISFFNKVNGINADIDLIESGTDAGFMVGVYSTRDINISFSNQEFSTDSNLTFEAWIYIQDNGIWWGWELDDPNDYNKYYYQILGNQYYNFSLSQLSNYGSDIKVEITSINGYIIYRVYSKLDNTLLLDKNISINDINITNFKGFDLVAFTSQVDDRDENIDAYKVSENIINNFITVDSNY